MSFKSSVRWTRHDFQKRLNVAADRLEAEFTRLGCPALTHDEWGEMTAAETPFVDAWRRRSMGEFETCLAKYVDLCIAVMERAAKRDPGEAKGLELPWPKGGTDAATGNASDAAGGNGRSSDGGALAIAAEVYAGVAAAGDANPLAGLSLDMIDL